MPVYKATIEIEVDVKDIDQFYEAIDTMNGVTVVSIAPHHDNPENFPDDW